MRQCLYAISAEPSVLVQVRPLPSIDLSRIRDHAGAKDRGFEEFAYLLAWDLENLDHATEIERRATPDGGIEFSCVPVGKGNGGRWAWQAKYLFRFDASTFAQMTKSVDAALANTPDLERYIFVLPKDRSTSAIVKWNTAVAQWTKKAKAKRMSVTFEFCGESQIVAAATGDEHAGAIRYFFDERFLTKKFMTNQVEREVKNLGERYSPGVNVETEIHSVIEAACRGTQFTARLKDLLSAPANFRPILELGGQPDRVIVDGAKTVETLLADWTAFVVECLDHIADPGDAIFRSMENHAKRVLEGIEKLQADLTARTAVLTDESRRYLERRRSAPTSRRTKAKGAAQTAEDERVRTRDHLRSFDTSLWHLHGSFDDVLRFLDSTDIAAAVSGSVLLIGEAGCGKSHLVADVATKRVAADLPSFLLLGQHLGTGVVDPQLVQMMGLGTLTLGDTLQALDVAARVRRKGRALLVVDAINEGAGADVWRSQLAGFVAEVARYPWIALVVTVRDVYESALMPGGVPSGMTKAEHRGLAGHEEEALNLYAAMYKLRLPDVPALLPEITNPLFLRSLCQSVQGRGLAEIPREAGGLVWVFDGLIDAVDQILQRSERLNYPDWEHRVQKAVAALASAMVDSGSEVLPIVDASAVCMAIHPQAEYSRSMLNGLIVEGVLLREIVDRDGQTTDSIRFTYQKLSDHLRANVILDRNPTNRELATAVRNIAKMPRPWAMRGVVSALVLLVPETRGVELAHVLRFGTNVVYKWSSNQTPSGWLRRVAQDALFETLLWRSPASFTATTHTLMKQYLNAGVVRDHEWLRIVSALACVPNHPLNSEWLHPVLWRMSLPQRDHAWSLQLLWVYSEDANPVERIVDWAWANPNAPEDVAQLVSVYLAWLFTSHNRRLRDTATKALVSITTHHPEVLTELVRRFAAVNDPYVIDRVIAAVYGHLLRRRHALHSESDLEAIKELGQAVYDAVFDAGEPAVHVMIRHRARMCVHLVDALCQAGGNGIGRDLSVATPTAIAVWPLTAPTAAKLAEGFGRTYDGYLGSATEIDWEFERKFERDVLEDLVLPEQDRLRTAKRRQLVRHRSQSLKRLINGTAPSRKDRVRRRADALLAQPLDNFRDFHQAWEAFKGSLPKASHVEAAKLREIGQELALLDGRVFHPDPDLCTRWIGA